MNAVLPLGVLWLTAAAPVLARAGDDGFIETQRLLPAQEAPWDYFGRALSLSGDTLAIGSDEYEVVLSPSGRMHLFRHDGFAWQQLQMIRPPDASIGDEFGISVGLDGGRLAVAAIRPGDLPAWQGKVYVYEDDGTQFVERFQLVASDGRGGDFFGRALDLCGDVLLVGAVGDNLPAGDDVGSAYVWRFDGAQWIEEKKLTASDGADGDEFARSVALGCDMLAIGAPRADVVGVDSGALYVYRFNGRRWREDAKLMPATGAAGDEFAWVVDLDGDWIVAGAPRADALGPDSGAAYMFRRDAGVWREEARLLPSDGAAGDEFGISVTLHGPRLLIGARKHDAAGVDAGALYVFECHDGVWSERQKLTASDAEDGDDFGYWGALDDDFVITCAARNDLGLPDSGAVYVFERPELPLVASPTQPTSGALLVLQSEHGQGGSLARFFLVDLAGVPMSSFLHGSLVNAAGQARLEGRVPPGLAGLSAGFQVFGTTETGVTTVSNVASVYFR